MTADINLDRLERELEQAVEADRRYWEKNDAKFRAVNQRVATYEEFKEIVNASHLKPLDRGEKVTEIRSSEAGLWNRGRCRGSPAGAAAGGDVSAAGNSLLAASASAEEPPASCQQFVRRWRALKTANDRCDYLLSLSPTVYSKLFASEIPFGLLGEFLTALDSAAGLDPAPALRVLTALAACQRFQLAVAFFSQSEKLAAQRLMKRLAELAETLTGECDEAAASDKPADLVARLSRLYLGGTD